LKKNRNYKDVQKKIMPDTAGVTTNNFQKKFKMHKNFFKKKKLVKTRLYAIASTSF